MFKRKASRADQPPPSEPRPAAAPAALPSAAAPLAKGKLAYESRRAEKAGMGLEKWMAEKDRRAQNEREQIARARRKAEAERRDLSAKPGLLRRLLDRAHRPL